MKRIGFRLKVILVALVPLAVLCGVMAQDRNGDPKMQAKRMLALRSGAQKVIESIEQLGQTSGIDEGAVANMLSEKMLSNVERFRSRDASLKSLKSVVVDQRREDFARQLRVIAKNTQTLSPLPISEADLIARLPSDWSRLRDENIARAVDQCYRKIFDKARQNAVALQKERISALINYPILEFVDAGLMRALKDRGDPARPLDAKVFQDLASDLKDVSLDKRRIFAGHSREAG